MRRFGKVLAVGSAVIAGPLLATTAVAIRDAVETGQNATDDDFSLDGAFVSPGPGQDPTASCDVNDDPCVVTGGGGGGWWWWTPGGEDWGGGGGSDGGCSSNDPSHCDVTDPFPSNPFGIALIGRDCPTERLLAAEALNRIYSTNTGRDLINRVAANGTSISLIVAQLSQSDIAFDSATNRIEWDPYVALTGLNYNGSEYRIAPLLVLAHELVHAANKGKPEEGDEQLAIDTANAIARELNTSGDPFGRQYNTDGTDYTPATSFYVNGLDHDNKLTEDTVARTNTCPGL